MRIALKPVADWNQKPNPVIARSGAQRRGDGRGERDAEHERRVRHEGDPESGAPVGEPDSVHVAALPLPRDHRREQHPEGARRGHRQLGDRHDGAESRDVRRGSHSTEHERRQRHHDDVHERGRHEREALAHHRADGQRDAAAQLGEDPHPRQQLHDHDGVDRHTQQGGQHIADSEPVDACAEEVDADDRREAQARLEQVAAHEHRTGTGEGGEGVHHHRVERAERRQQHHEHEQVGRGVRRRDARRQPAVPDQDRHEHEGAEADDDEPLGHEDADELAVVTLLVVLGEEARVDAVEPERDHGLHERDDRQRPGERAEVVLGEHAHQQQLDDEPEAHAEQAADQQQRRAAHLRLARGLATRCPLGGRAVGADVLRASQGALIERPVGGHVRPDQVRQTSRSTSRRTVSASWVASTTTTLP
jgi:hypothetical protein